MRPALGGECMGPALGGRAQLGQVQPMVLGVPQVLQALGVQCMGLARVGRGLVCKLVEHREQEKENIHS